MQEKLFLNAVDLNGKEEGSDAPLSFAVFPQSPAKGRDGRYFNYNAKTIIENFKKDQKDIPIDLDHHSEMGFNTKAVAWVKELFQKDNQIHASVEWTKEGKELVESKAYRYISPAVYVDKGNNAVLLSSIALTNHPNLKLPSLNNKQDLNNSNNKENAKNMEQLKILNSALGLEENADTSKALNKIQELKDKQVDLNSFVPKADYELALNKKNELEQELNNIKQEALTKEANSLVETAIKHGQISANSKGFYLDLCKDQDGIEKVKNHLKEQPKLTDTIHAHKKDNIKQEEGLSNEALKHAKDWGLTKEDLLKAKKSKEEN